MISVVIPVYKNTEEFLKNLRKNLSYFNTYEVIVINDDPSKSIAAEMKQFPAVKLYENEKNMGFGQTVNIGVKRAKNPYILLLNTDVILKNESFKKLVPEFKKNPELFGVSFAQIEKDGSTVGKNRFYWKWGFFYHEKSPNNEFGLNAWAEGGSCLLDKEKFLELHGFDALYSPFYWEDIDLSYRAWKKGYKVVFDPAVVVEHHHGGTTDKFIQSNFKNTTAARNHYIFIWKNITDENLLWQHILLLPFNLLYFTVKGDKYLLKGFLKAVMRLPEILKSRRKNIVVLNDAKVFSFFKNSN
jgi:GT2 family glycosyltransferase